MRLGPGHRRVQSAELPPGWINSSIGDVCEIVQGGRLGFTKESDYRLSGFPAYSAGGQDGFVKIPEFDREGVVLSAIGANCGRCFYARGNWTTLANVQAILPDLRRLSAKFLYHRANVDGFWPRSGSAQPFIKPSDVLKCWVAHPEDIVEQSRITDVLDTVDEAIAKTDAVIAKLKQVRAGLLHDLLTCGLDENGQLRDPVVHPEQFQDSHIGLIPKEWETKALRQLTEFISYGFTNPMPTTRDGPWMLTAFDIGDGKINYEQARHTSSVAYDVLLTEKSKPHVGDILVTKDGSLGRVAILDQENACINQSVAVLRPLVTTASEFLVEYLRSPAGQTAMLAETGGSSIKHIYISKLADMSVPQPGKSEQRGIVRMLTTCEVEIESEEKVLAKLRLLKSGLINDLLTGGVRVPAGLDLMEPRA